MWYVFYVHLFFCWQRKYHVENILFSTCMFCHASQSRFQKCHVRLNGKLIVARLLKSYSFKTENGMTKFVFSLYFLREFWTFSLGGAGKWAFLRFFSFGWLIYTLVVAYLCISNRLYGIVTVPVRNSVPVPTTYVVFCEYFYDVIICIYWHQLFYYSSSIHASTKHCTGPIISSLVSNNIYVYLSMYTYILTSSDTV